MHKKTVLGIVFGFIGLQLSPLIWWNDLFVNIPLAYAISWPFNLLSETGFQIAFLLSYWGSNVLGFILMRIGVSIYKNKKVFSFRVVLVDFGISLLFTVIITVLLYGNVINPVKF